MNSLRKYVVFTIIAIAAVLLAVYFLIPDKLEVSLTAWGEETTAETEPGIASAKPVLPTDSQTGSTGDISFADCTRLLSGLKNSAIANRPQWADYLEAGYSLDEVTLAIEHFIRPEFATSFRLRILRQKNSPGYDEHRMIPDPALADFSQMTPDEKMSALATAQITVDDIARFIALEPMPTADILMMLPYVDDPAAVVRSEWEDAISLLDYAAAASQLELFKELLNLGLQPSADNYLKSTMEWALTGLSSCSDNCDDAVEIVQILHAMGEGARFDVKNEGLLKAQFSHGSYDFYDGLFDQIDYEFYAPALNRFLQHYGLDLTQIDSRQVPTLDENNALVREIEKNQRDLFQKQKGADFDIGKIDACERMVEALQEQWKPLSVSETIKKVAARYPGAPQQVKSELARIDPALVDAYQFLKQEGSHVWAEVEDNWRIWNRLDTSDITAVIEHFESQSLSDDNKQTLVMQMIRISPAFYKELSRSSLMLEPIQYFDIEFDLSVAVVQEFEEAGLDMHRSDKRDKSLLFYAVNQSDIELVEYMEERGYPYSFGDSGQDPLHVALRRGRHEFVPEFTAKVVPVLMRYNPEINDFHRSRMAVIQLKYPDLYAELTSRYPQLAVRPDTQLPRVR